MKQETVRTGGVSLCTLLTVAFVTLKLCKDRLVVVVGSRPLWGPWAIAFAVIGLIGVVVVFCKAAVHVMERRSK